MVHRDAATPPSSQWHTCNGVSALVAYLHSWTAHTSGLSEVLGGGKWAPVAAWGGRIYGYHLKIHIVVCHLKLEDLLSVASVFLTRYCAAN